MSARTICTVCNREVGVLADWNRRQGQQDEQYRVVRHRANEKYHKNGGNVICTGTGVRVLVPA